MPELTNNRRELFARHLAKGMNAYRAYEAAGYRPHRSNAWFLSNAPDVRARVKELMDDVVPVTAQSPTADGDIGVELPEALRRAAYGWADLVGVTLQDYVASAVTGQLKEDARWLALMRAAVRAEIAGRSSADEVRAAGAN